MLATALSAITLNQADESLGLIGIAVWAGIYLVIALGVQRLEKRVRVWP